MRGEEYARNLHRAWEKTLALYEATFGKAAPSDLWPKSNRCPNCGAPYKIRQGKVEEQVDKVSHELNTAAVDTEQLNWWLRGVWESGEGG